MVGANNVEQTVPVTLGVQGSTDDQILTGLTLGEKVLTSTATAGTGGAGGFPFGGRGGVGGGLGGVGGGSRRRRLAGGALGGRRPRHAAVPPPAADRSPRRSRPARSGTR